jgi:DNA polymerase-3 subunit delta'
LNCLKPVKRGGTAIDCCDQCLNCQRIDHGNHPDTYWVRAESKSRIITIDQMRELMQVISLKPTEGGYKVAGIIGADRLNVQAANAFLKTLEEPPPKSLFILASIAPQQILETILSRCLRLNFAGMGHRRLPPAQLEWLGAFSDLAGQDQKSLMGRYRLLDVLLGKLNQLKDSIEEALTAQSPLQRYKDAEKQLQEKWEDELKAAIEAEYRRQRGELLLAVQWWMRDVWLRTLPQSEPSNAEALLNFPKMAGTEQVAKRVSAQEAVENLDILEQLQRLLGSNVQEALALEVGMLKLKL